MWGSLQLDWPFSLVVVVVITITSRSHRSPSTDDCKYSTPACVSVCLSTVVGSLLYVAAIYPCFLPHIAPSPLSQPRLSELSHLSVLRSLSSFSSLTLSLFLRRQKHGAFLTGSDRSHFPLPPPPSTISTNQCPPPLLPLSLLPEHSPQTGSGAPLLRLVLPCFLLMHCVLFTEILVGWLWSLGGLVSGVLPHPTPSPSFLTSAPPQLFPPVPTCLKCVLPPSFPPPNCGFVACIRSISTLQSSLSILYNTVPYCMSLQTCHVGLSWFDFMFCYYYDDFKCWYYHCHRSSWLFWQDVIGVKWCWLKETVHLLYPAKKQFCNATLHDKMTHLV